MPPGRLNLAPAIAEIDPRAEGVRRGPDDPLLNALIWKLPSTGEAFSADARSSWLKMMTIAFDVTYGPAEGVIVPSIGLPDNGKPAAAAAAPAAPAPKPTKAPHQAYGCDYYVDGQGFARCDFEADGAGVPRPTPNRRVSADEAMNAGEIYDYRGAARDRSTIVWDDDSVGAQPGMNFCGPG